MLFAIAQRIDHNSESGSRLTHIRSSSGMTRKITVSAKASAERETWCGRSGSAAAPFVWRDNS